MAAENKDQSERKRFGELEDLILLKEIASTPPFLVDYGNVMRAWNSIVERMKSHPEFRFTSVSAKAARARFHSLLNKHKTENAESARASGVAEDETEMTVLLDDLMVLKNDHEESERQRKEFEKDQATQLEKSGEVIRTQAMSRLKRSVNDAVGEDGCESGESGCASTPVSKRAKRALTSEMVGTMIDMQRSSNETFLELIRQDMAMRERHFAASQETQREIQRNEYEQRRQERRDDKKDFMMMLQACLSRYSDHRGIPVNLVDLTGKSHSLDFLHLRRCECW